eukprot:207013_1
MELVHDKKSHYPIMKPISTTSLRLCCGSSTNSADITPLEIPIQDPTLPGAFFVAEYVTTGQCQLSSDSRDSILPMRVTECRWKEGSKDMHVEYKHDSPNYPVRVSCVDSGSE